MVGPRAAAGRRPRFQAGGALIEGALYVERPADRELPEALRRGEFCYVLAPRQIGKSSLRLRATKRLVAEGLACVTIDLTSLGTENSSPETWYVGLTAEVAQGLDLPPPDDFWERNKALGPVHAFSRYMEEVVLGGVEGQVVVFIDEIDATLSLPFARDDFFAAVRAFYNRRPDHPENARLTFCLLGVAAPGDLISDPTRTPFNIGRAIRLEDFSRAEASALAEGLEGSPEERARLLEEVLDWTSGHPYMTQRVCNALVGEARGQPVAEVVAAKFLERGRTEDPNLQAAERWFDEARLRKAGSPAPKMLRLYRQLLSGQEVPADGADPVQLGLRLTGLAAERDQPGGPRRMAVRNRIFARVFDAGWARTKEAGRVIADPLARWVESGRKEGFLMGGEALREAQAWAEGRDDLNADERAFLQASERAEQARAREEERRRAQRTLVMVLVGMITLLAGALGVALWQWGRARELSDKAEASARDAELGQAKAEEARRKAEESQRKAEESHQKTEEARQNAQDSAKREEAAKKDAQDAASRAGEQRQKAEKSATRATLATKQAEEAAARATLEAKRKNIQRLAAHADAAGTSFPQRRLLLAVEGVRAARDVGVHIGSEAEQSLADGVWATVESSVVVRSRGAGHPELSGDGKHILTSVGNAMTISNIDDPVRRIISRTPHDDCFMHPKLSPDHKRILAIGHNNSFTKYPWIACVWNTDGSGQPALLRAHKELITTADFSPDGRFILTVSWDGTAQVWNGNGTRHLVTFRDHEGKIFSARFSRDSNQIVTASEDGTARVWRVDLSEEPIVLKANKYALFSAAFSPDGKQIVTGSVDRTARIWYANGSGEPVEFTHEDSVRDAVFSEDGSQILTTLHDNSLRVARVHNPSNFVALRGHTARIKSAVFSSDGERVLTASDDKTARIWSIASGATTVLRGHDAAVSSAAFSADGEHILTSSEDGTVRLWSEYEGQYLTIGATDPQSRMMGASFSPDSRHLLVASGKTAQVWEAGSLRRPVVVFRSPDWNVTSASYSPDGQRILVTDGYSAYVLDSDSSAPPIVLSDPNGRVLSAAFSANGKRILTSGTNHTVRLWNADGSNQPIILDYEDYCLTEPQLSADGQRLLTDSLSATRIWSMDGSNHFIELRRDISFGYPERWERAIFSPDGKRILAWEHGDVYFLRPDGSGEPSFLTHLDGWSIMSAFSLDGSRVALASESSSGHAVRVLFTDGRSGPVDLRGHDDGITSLAFNADGTRLLSTSRDKTARVWNSDGSGEPLILRGHQGAVTGAEFSPDGKRVVTISGEPGLDVDGTVRVWVIDVEILLTKACQYAGRNLTRDEWARYMPGEPYRKTCPQWPEDPAPNAPQELTVIQ